MSTFVINPLPAGDVETGTPTAVHLAAGDRAPCRRCLRDASAGEELVLAPYDPFTVRSPYAGDGPVFVHADGCERFEPEPDAMSEQIPGRTLSIRAYDADAMLTDAAVLPGERFVDGVRELLGDPDTAFLHVHFAGPGCFAFRVDRA
jgi:hypothetical protein